MKLQLPKKQTIYLATSFDQLPKLLDKLVETYELTDEHLAYLRGIATNAGNVHVICWFPDENAFKFTTGYRRSIVYDPNCCDVYELRNNEWFQIHIEGVDFLTNQMLAEGIVDAQGISENHGIKRMFDIFNKKFISKEIKKSNKEMNDRLNEKFIKKMNDRLNEKFINKMLEKNKNELYKSTNYISNEENELDDEIELDDDINEALNYMINN